MAAEFKTLNFPNNAKGQQQKNQALQEYTRQGWEVVSLKISIKANSEAEELAVYTLFASL